MEPNYKLSTYLKEDFLVNNAPDIQTGISIKIPIAKKLNLDKNLLAMQDVSHPHIKQNHHHCIHQRG